ncbi:MAG TPA: two-component regulator propeller domain-containing protein [Puia sp.]|nr:two-component regulator propeller domain-containing protein [Puia sp.]
MNFSVTTILLALLLTVSCCLGQVNEYPFSKLDIRDGLSNNQVNTIYKDRRGFMWFGTQSGLTRYDGYTCKVFRHNDQDSLSLINDNISCLCEGPGERLWVFTISTINIYDPATERFDRRPGDFLRSIHLPEQKLVTILKTKGSFWFVYADSGVYVYTPGKAPRGIRPGVAAQSLLNNPVRTAGRDSNGYLWLVHNNGILEKLDVGQGKVLFRTDILQKQNPGVKYGYLVYIDNQSDFWLYQPGNLYGLYKYDPRANTLGHFSKDSGELRLSSNLVNDVVQDDKGLIWIATDHGGVTVLDKARPTVRYLLNSEEERSLADNSVNTLYKDDFGIIWLGSYKKGVNYYHENIIRFPLFRKQPAQPNSLPYDDVNRFAEDKKGNLWIGTNGGGLIYFDRKRNIYTRYRHEAGDPNSLTNDIIVGLYVDRQGIVWIGTYLGGLDCYDGQRFTHYRHNDAITTSLSDNRVSTILEDSDGNLWVGTMFGGLDRFDRGKKGFYHNNPSVPFSVHAAYISSLAEDTAGDLWIGTAFGIDVLRKRTGKFTHYIDVDSRLSYNNVNDLCRDHKDNMWVATPHGLNVMTPGTDTFRTFLVKDGLPDNAILNIQEDNEYNLWVSTPNGVSKIVLTEDAGKIAIHCTNYDEYDGLQGQAFNENASLKTREGELIFGGANGFNLFKPSDIRKNDQAPPVVLTDFQLFNKNIGAGEKWKGNTILKSTITETDKLVLTYYENDISLEFAALSFTNTKKNKYAYLLQGFNKDWVMTDGKARKATYTNLDPGEYIFRVKASNNDGVWNEKGAAIKIIVLPPFWKTPWAYFLYVLLGITILYFARLLIIRRAKARFALSQEREEALRLHELDRMKIKFLTNVSHEFRTPLSLILAPVDKLVKSAEDNYARSQFQLIQRNAKRLLHLVNQLLDFRKMEVNELTLNRVPGDIVQFIKETSCSFLDLAERKNIDLSYREGIDRLQASYDPDKMERILFNLLSNAFKFTPENGKIKVEVDIADREGPDVLLKISVRDTGIGIPADMHQKIFEPFIQHTMPVDILNQGSGIGLAITRELVEMHGGSIKVESEVDRGSCFTVLLPVTEMTDLPAGEGINSAQARLEAGDPERDGAEVVDGADAADGVDFADGANGVEAADPAGKSRSKRLTVLLIEDNEDFRFYLKDNLKGLFHIIEAANGKEGWQKSLSAHPDLVVSDVSMPIMDGVELCRKIKADPRTRHIPVILLTALTGEQDQLRALETGPNDYITKPFNFEILVYRIKNLLEYKETVKKTYQKRVEIDPGDIEADTSDRDEDFIKTAVTVIEANMANPDFSVEEWCQELHLSRTSLYKRIVALTGKTPIEFIRSIRLKRSAQLLEKTHHNIAEIAYMVGFNNPKYFARYFKEEYDMLPSAYQAEKWKKGGE